MRLIDADELLKHKGNCYDINGHLLYAVGTGDIMAAKTIDPVKQGEWLPHPTERDWDVCSVCGLGTHRRFHYNEAVYGGYDVEESYSYCPQCGAKMDGGEG